MDSGTGADDDKSGLALNEQLAVVGRTLDVLFPEQQQEDKKIYKVKSILGDLAKNLSNQDLLDILTEVQFLANSWLDEYERTLFDGKTLTEVLHEKEII